MGTAWCGPACQVVWGLGERFPRLPDWVFNKKKAVLDKHRLGELNFFLKIKPLS